MWGLCNFDSFTGIYFDGNKSENELNTTSAGLKYQSKHSARVKDKKRISYVLFLQFQYIWWINAKFLVISDQNKFIKIDIALFKYIYIYIYITSLIQDFDGNDLEIILKRNEDHNLILVKHTYIPFKHRSNIWNMFTKEHININGFNNYDSPVSKFTPAAVAVSPLPLQQIFLAALLRFSGN